MAKKQTTNSYLNSVGWGKISKTPPNFILKGCAVIILNKGIEDEPGVGTGDASPLLVVTKGYPR